MNEMEKIDTGMDSYNYLFSVIMPVYNVEEYLEETLESIINQSIGFEKYIQLILVNNASEDNSEVICKKYASLYPNNIIYIELKENGGPSKGRNAGIPYIMGNYVTFMDSDDKWKLDAFDIIKRRIENSKDLPLLLCCREYCFDAVNKWFVFDHLYKKTRWSFIFENYTDIIVATHASFIHSSLLQHLKFDEDLFSCEDTPFICQVLAEVKKFIIVREAVYYYRQRTSSLSHYRTVISRREFFNDFIASMHKIVGICETKYGYLIPYFQFLIMRSLAVRSFIKLPDFFTEKEVDDYMAEVHNFLQKIDDDIILQTKQLSVDQRNYFLRLKYNENIYEKALYRYGKLYYRNLLVYSLVEEKILLEFMEIKNNTLRLKGIINFALGNPENAVSVYNNDKKYEINITPSSQDKTVYCFNTPILERKFFDVAIPLEDKNDIIFYITYKEHTIRTKFLLGNFSKLSNKLVCTYYLKNDYLVFNKNNLIIKVNKVHSFVSVMQKEKNLVVELIKKKKLNVLFYRWAAKLVKKFYSNKQIWLVSDRIMTADDSAEYFFRYLSTKNLPDIKVYFLLSNKSEDYTRLKQYGNIIDVFSLKHKVFFWASSKIISSLTNDWVINPMPGIYPYLRDMLDFNFIHVQHGIVKDDLSKALNQFKKNIHMFVTSSELEQKSILSAPYGYDESIVKVTGLPRFDSLSFLEAQNIGNVVLFAPTWRFNLTGAKDKEKDLYKYNPLFKKSEFFKFYNKLINDERICDVLKKYNMKGALRLHPMLQVQSCDFEENDVIQIQQKRKLYKDDMLETALVVTDYSSAAFDYAYYNRCVVYSQFDKEEFYSSHTYQEGYFNYETMGFGPVCYDYDSTVEAIIKAVESGCIMNDFYKERVNNFFKYRDNKNCERIYHEILKLDQEQDYGIK